MLRVPTHRPLAELETIEFYASQIPPNADMAQLAPCTRLNTLRFIYTHVPTSFLTQVLARTSITALGLGSGSLMNENDVSLVAQKGGHLRSLHMDMGSAVYRLLAECTTLTNLDTLKIPLSSTETNSAPLIPSLPHFRRLTFLDIACFTLTPKLISMLSTDLPRLRTLRAESNGYSGPLPAIDPLIDNLNLTSLSLCFRPLLHTHVAALGRSSTLVYLNLYYCDYKGSCKPLATNTSLAWLDIASSITSAWNHLELFSHNSSLTGLHLSVDKPELMAKMELNKQRITQWIRHDFLTSLIYIAAQRSSPNSASPWRMLPLDMIVSIFSRLEQVGKTAVQISSLVEFVFANIIEIWAYLGKEKRGVQVLEARTEPRSKFKWQSRTPAIYEIPKANLTDEDQPPKGKQEDGCVLQ